MTLRILPTSGYGMDIKYWILPIGVLFLRPFGMLVQVVRASMINALSSAYVKTARVRRHEGEPHQLYVHALRNAAAADRHGRRRPDGWHAQCHGDH